MKKTLLNLVLILAINLGLALLLFNLAKDWSHSDRLLVKIAHMILVIGSALLIIKKDLKAIKLFKNNFWSIPTLSILLVLAFNFISNKMVDLQLDISLQDHLAYLTGCLLVGLFEELVFRVYVFNGLLSIRSKEDRYKRPFLFRTIFVTSLLFGIAHATNILSSTNDWLGVLSQIIFAVFIGVFLQAVFLRSQNLLLVSVIHGLVNYIGMHKSKLFQIKSEAVEFTLSETLMSFGLTTLFFMIIIVPISYLLIRPRISQPTP